MENVNDALPLSVLILTDHVDSKLERCLSSAAWAAEVILGWTRDEKLTVDESRKLTQIIPTIKIHHIPGKITNFAGVRNQLQTHATTEWIFWLDSDEVIMPTSIQYIAEILRSEDAMGALIHRQDVFDGKVLNWGEVKNVKILRMFHRSAGQFIRPVHEVAIVEGEVKDPGIVIQHYAHDSISSFISKVTHYATIEAQLRYQKGKRATVFELIAWPLGKFLYNVFVNRAFLDGWRGIAYATVMSIHSLTVRASLIELQSPHEKS